MSYLPRTSLPNVDPRPNMQLDARQRAVLQTIWALNVVEREWLDKDGYFQLRSTGRDVIDSIFTEDGAISYKLQFREKKYRIFCHYSTSLDFLDDYRGDVVISLRKRHNCGVFYAMLKLADCRVRLDKLETFPCKELR